MALTDKEREDIKNRLAALKQEHESIVKQQTEKKKKKDNSALVSVMRYTHLGFEFVLIFMAGLFAGDFLDTYFDTSPWLLLIGILLGFAMAMGRIIAISKELEGHEKTSGQDAENSNEK